MKLPDFKHKSKNNFRDSDEKLERKDVLAMIISALLVFVPLILIIGGIAMLVYFL